MDDLHSRSSGQSPTNPHEALVRSFPLLERQISLLTGVMRDGQYMPTRTKLGRTIQSFFIFALGIGAGVAALPAAGDRGFALLPLAIGLAVAGARDLQLSILHHAAHDNVFPHKDSQGHRNRYNDYLGRLISGLLLIERFDAYKASHTVDHHGRNSLSTCEDGTMLALQKVVGIRPGVSVKHNFRQLALTMVSPKAHFLLLNRRMKSQFTAGSSIERVAAYLYVGGVMMLAAGTGWWVPLLLGWALPLTVGYQASQMLRFVVEHQWEPASAPGGRRSRAEYEALTVAVRCVAPMPQHWTVFSAIRWSAEMILNCIVRFVCLPGESGPSHAWHHGKPRGDWPNHIQEAHAWEKEKREDGREPTREAWGILSALRLSFESFANARAGGCQ